jgi:phosphoribosylglycinamide formyltransferase-1
MTVKNDHGKSQQGKTRWVALASGEGTTIEAIQSSNERVGYTIVGVVTDRQNAGINARAKKLGIPCKHVVANSKNSNAASDLIMAIESFNPEMILLAGYLKKIDAAVISHFKRRIFNCHPSLLPKYGGHGMYGSNVHKKVFENGDKIAGVTIHEVNEEFDQGRIVFQEEISTSQCKTWEQVEEKVKDFEKKFLVNCLNKKKVEWTGG